MRIGRWSLLVFGLAAAACASTIGPVIPSIQVLVVLDSLDDTLRIIPVDSPGVMHKLVVNSAAKNRHALALNDGVAAIGYAGATGSIGSAFTVNLGSHLTVCQSVTLNRTRPIASLAFGDNGFVYGAIPESDSVSFFNPQTQPNCFVGAGNVRHGPQGFVNARTRFFVIVANPCPSGQGGCTQSWLTTSFNNGAAPLSDSIGLSPPGNAQGAVLASDGLLYVINAGNSALSGARLSQVNPVTTSELVSIAGFGTLPGYIGTDGERVFVADSAHGLMVYNTRTNHVDRDANSAIPLVFGRAPRGLSVDDFGRVYALISGGCSSSGQPGLVSVFGSDLVSRSPVTVGHCPVAIGVTDIPSTLYNFSN